ncbi:hypothetical protein JCM15764A_24490 [Geotalea toluenoxydans]
MNGIIFVYNADSGLFNTLTDIAHKVFSPETYSCNLCAITHGNFGMRQEWKDFLETLEISMQFLHRDEFHERYGMQGLALPAVLVQEGGQLRLLVSADEIGRCADMADLKGLLQEKLK